MSILFNARVLAALAGLIGIVVSLVYPEMPEQKVVGVVSALLTFLAGLFQPAPGQKKLPTGEAS